jgi:alpha-N-arabinofuranosidase
MHIINDELNVSVRIDSENILSVSDDRMFGSFIEHLGRAVYGGIFEPDHPSSDEQGFRTDVMMLVRELRVPIIRYPGGNYVSAYKWEDAVGPVNERPRRMDLAWKAIEPNTVGIDEFYSWARKVGSDVMIALNLGTRGIEEARNFVEYCNHPGGLYWSDLRKSHGREQPYRFKVWCLGNEMDGPWQIGSKSADEYGKLACEVAKALKLFDPNLELVVCGSSGPGMPTFPQWEATVLEHCYDHVDYISLHTYARRDGGTLRSFFEETVQFENCLKAVEGTIQFVKAKKRSRKDVKISVDEWNVWYHSLGMDSDSDLWQVGRRLLEDEYTVEDALGVGCFLIVLLRHADSVRMACLAQLVNTIAPIRAEPGAEAWRQTIFYPFLHCSLYGRGEVLATRVSSPGFESSASGTIPYVDAIAVMRREDREISLFCVNRHETAAARVVLRLAGYADVSVIEHLALSDSDPLASNSRDNPSRVVPKSVNSTVCEGATLAARIEPLSWNFIRISYSGFKPS